MRSFAFLCTLGLAAFAAAQDPQAPEPTTFKNQLAQDAVLAQQSPSYQAFLQAVGGHWTSHWNYATGTPSDVYGEGIPLPDWRGSNLVEARRQAQLALAQYSALLGLGVSEFRESIGAPMGNCWSFTFDQYFRQLPAIGGRADVRINRRGVIAFLGSVAWPIPANFNTVPTINEANAELIARRLLAQEPGNVPQPGNKQPTRLVIWGDTTAAQQAPFFLAWEVPVSAVDLQGNGPIGRYYIDAVTGAPLHYTSDKHDCGLDHLDAVHAPHGSHALLPTQVTVMAWTRTGADGFSALVNTPLSGLVLNVPGIGAVTTDANGQFTVDIAAPVNVTVGALDGSHCNLIQGANAPSGIFPLTPGVPATIQLLTAAATFNEAAHTTALYWVNRTNEFCRSILGNSTQLNIADGVVPTVNIASTCNAFYTNNTINFYQAGGGCNNTAFSTVIAHEWGHGLDDRYGGISQTQGLSEGWGDIIGMYIVDSPILGSGFQSPGVGIRNGLNNTMYPPPSEVHAAGEVWMGFAWRLRDNLRAAFGTPLAQSISNSIVIGSIVANATDQTSAVRQVFIADDDDGNLNNGVPHYAQLSAAAIAKNLPYPQIQVGTITHTALANTTVQLTPRSVVATATPISGTFTQVNLVYNDGANHVRSMIPTGTLNQYQALVPGEIAPAAISYHIEAVHSTGPIVRFPPTGELTFSVGADTIFYTEGFETGGAGWVHGSIVGTDDWQIGAPAGFSGTSLGVAWHDPNVAGGGVSCAGNDLGIGVGFNGAYAANSENFLRSPVINCSGRTNVRLRFKRWLSVEEATYDHATIRVNGLVAWGNPIGTHVLDLGWSTVEVAIPIANNNPAVQLEWHLQTDPGLQLGGWSVDDVQLVASGSLPPLAAQLRMLPEQAAGNAPMTLTVNTAGAQPLVLAIGDTAGPTNIPGIPPLLVGGNTVALPSASNAAGLLTFNFNAPAPATATGLMWFSQVLTLDAGSNLVTSNQFINLFTQ